LGESKSISKKIDRVKLTITTDYKYKNKAIVSYLLERTDISANM